MTTDATTPSTDDATDHFGLLELDLSAPPQVAPAKAVGPVAAPAVTPVAAPTASTLNTLTAQLNATDTVEACEALAREIAAGPVGKLHREDPLRVALRQVALARIAALRTPVAPVAAPVVAAPVVVEPAPTSPGLSLEQSLGGIAVEAATNAAGQASGSLRDGTMRAVGFSTAEGYVTALRNGTKEPTTSQYLQILRTRFGYTEAQIAGLTIGKITQQDLPVGQGIVHDHTVNGKTVFDLQREAAAAAAKLVRETADATTLALAQRLTVADSPQAWWEIGWSGAGSITRAELIEACDEAPEPKVPSTQLSRTIDSLRGTHDAAMVSTRPQGVKVRWQIGRGKQHAAYVGAEYGQVLAIVDLRTDNTLSFDGDPTIAAEVEAEYNRLCGDEVLRPGDVTSWLQQLLRKRFEAVRSGDRFLISPKHKDAARTLCGRIARVWSVGNWVLGRLGEDGKPELGVTYQDVATVIGGIWQGVAAEVTEAEERWAKTMATADGEPGATACANELERIDGTKPGEGLLARVNGFTLIGEGPLKPLRARVVALRAAVVTAQSKIDDSKARFAALELK